MHNDLTKLKELAERALACAPGEWFVENGIDQVRDGDGDFVCETGEDEPIKATYIAAANPQAILGLLERLEKAEQHWANENSNNMALIAEVERLRKDAERWLYARMILPYEVIQDAQKDFESWHLGVSEAENKRCDEAIDAAMAGGGK